MADGENAKPAPQIISNTVVCKGDDGKLQVFDNGERMVGTVNVSITTDGALIVAVLPHAFRMVGMSESKLPVFVETKDNVIQFPLMEAYRKRWAEEAAAESPTRDAVEETQEIVAVPHSAEDDDDAPEH